MLKVSYNILHLVLILKVIFLIVRHGWTLALSMTLVRNILNIIACYFICQHAFPLGRKMKMWTWNWKSFEWLKDWRKVANMVRKKNRDDTSRTQGFFMFLHYNHVYPSFFHLLFRKIPSKIKYEPSWYFWWLLECGSGEAINLNEN